MFGAIWRKNLAIYLTLVRKLEKWATNYLIFIRYWDAGSLLNDSDALDEVWFILVQQAADGRLGKSLD